MRIQRHGIRGPTRADKVNDRAGNAVVGFSDRGGSGTNQPSRVSRYLAPAFSVDGGAGPVKVGVSAHHDPRSPACRCGGQTHRRVRASKDGRFSTRKWDRTR